MPAERRQLEVLHDVMLVTPYPMRPLPELVRAFQALTPIRRRSKLPDVAGRSIVAPAERVDRRRRSRRRLWATLRGLWATLRDSELAVVALAKRGVGEAPDAGDLAHAGLPGVRGDFVGDIVERGEIHRCQGFEHLP